MTTRAPTPAETAAIDDIPAAISFGSHASVAVIDGELSESPVLGPGVAERAAELLERFPDGVGFVVDADAGESGFSPISHDIADDLRKALAESFVFGVGGAETDNDLHKTTGDEAPDKKLAPEVHGRSFVVAVVPVDGAAPSNGEGER